MAPLRTINFGAHINTGLAKISRDVASIGNADSFAQAEGASGSGGGSAASNSTVYLGIGLGVGGAFLLGLIVVVILSVKKRREHKRAIEAMEVDEALQTAQRQRIAEIPRPVSVARCSTLVPLHARAGWGPLSSDETLNEPERAAKADQRKRASVSLPKKLKQRGIPLKKLKRLTAILESPRPRTTNSPALPIVDIVSAPPVVEESAPQQAESKAYNFDKANEDDDVFICPGSPKLTVLPSFAIRSPDKYGASIENHDINKASRSRSVSAMPAIPTNAMFGHSEGMSRPPMHVRSISLGAPPTRPPSGPIPPIPVVVPHGTESEENIRQAVRVSRLSSSSQDSAGSSVLVTTPILMVPEQDQPIPSPSLEEIVAQEDNASLKTVATNQWQSPLVNGGEAITDALRRNDLEVLKAHTSIRSNIARYSAESMASERLSSTSVRSPNSLREHLSMAQIGLADQVIMSRVSSENSLQSHSSVRNVATPRKVIRASVSASGSPAERKKSSILRDISGNSIAPSRQTSNATQDSTRSSNGNPFQWDTQPLAKPSALKGSPNARKGHRRQNCVRISTLTPQILGPPPSRPTSPNIMHGIEEEPGDGDELATQLGARFVSNRRPSRPLSASSFGPNLRPLRASLTPSSPTLSEWTAYQEHGIPSQSSDSQLSGSAGTRSASRLSNRSSVYSIPYFPSPVKAATYTTQLSQPIPEFYLSRPSTDIDENDSSSPFAFRLSSDPDIPSSPPLPVSKSQEYDPAHPAWATVTIPAPKQQEYDPASPHWDETEPERSSAFFPFATPAHEIIPDDEVSPRSRPASYGGDLPDTPPLSPKSMPEGFQAFFDKKDMGSIPARASEKLTSANASTIMAKLPSPVDFPGAPVLAPPDVDEAYAQIQPAATTQRQRSVSNAAYLIPMRPAPPPPSAAPVKDPCVPSPLHITGKTSPTGPRIQPAQSVLKNAMALRRMNSEANSIGNRESRRYVRLGREASPLLPFIGSPDPGESCADMNELFDFDFAADARSGAEEDGMLEEVDVTEVERKLDGALAGFSSAAQSRSLSVWEDGEEYWKQDESPEIGTASSSPFPLKVTPTKSVLESPRSIQQTPKSLYDSDGFLRT